MISDTATTEMLKKEGDFSTPDVPVMPELLAPAGNWECARAAVENGADAIYFGLDRFNARMRADNFRCADLPELMEFLHSRGVRGYVTFNTLVFTDELAEAEVFLREIIAAGVDAAIVQDVGICRLIRSLSPDFPIHVSTQMTVTSAAGVRFAKSLGADLVVIARENSLEDIRRIQEENSGPEALPLETFVHGALCVAYSGQCLTSEALGGRSANRGECAQACRMTYQLVVDGQPRDLGNRQYLLSPQDLAGIGVIPDLAGAGIRSLKIEGRLKAPEYVAAITRAYREALDARAEEFDHAVADSRYAVEMAFSRGLYTGWLRGIDNQKLVHARYGKKRGVLLGEVVRIDSQNQTVWARLETDVKAGDGVAFEDTDKPETESEQGGSVFRVYHSGNLTGIDFGPRRPGSINLKAVRPGFRIWKTADPHLQKQIRSTYAGEKIRFRRPVDMAVSGTSGKPLHIKLCDPWSGFVSSIESATPLEPAEEHPLEREFLERQLGRLGNTPVQLRSLQVNLDPGLILPVSEINRMRRELVTRLENHRREMVRWTLRDHPVISSIAEARDRKFVSVPEPPVGWAVTIREQGQLQPVIDMGVRRVYCEFEDPKKYRDVVAQFRRLCPDGTILVAPPRIFKPGEEWVLKIVASSDPDGYLIRNFDHLEFFNEGYRMGDFSLNVANPLSARWFVEQCGLDRITASYDMNLEQLVSFARQWTPEKMEVCIHQRMPLFHMEHCVFCTFLSTGRDYRDCGRPCEKHQVEMVDRVGEKHFLRADAGCRNTLYNSRVQTGAEYFADLRRAGIGHFRLDFLNERASEIRTVIQAYQQLSRDEISGSDLWRQLKLTSRLGVTRGQLHQPESGAWR